jgi:type IV pilus assembly protein PilM
VELQAVAKRSYHGQRERIIGRQAAEFGRADGDVLAVLYLVGATSMAAVCQLDALRRSVYELLTVVSSARSLAMLFKQEKNQRKRERAIGLDFGASEVRGIVIRRRGSTLELEAYAERPLAGIVIGKLDDEMSAGGHVAELLGNLKVQDRRVFAAISSPSAVVCHTEFPQMPLEEVKGALRLNGARYLHRDFSNCYLDAVELVESSPEAQAPKAGKMQLLVGGASKKDVLWYRNALVAARARPETIELAAISAMNAFQAVEPEICQKEITLLVDMGAHSTAMSFLRRGLPLFTRITHFGGQHVTEYIGQMLTLGMAAAEEEKLKMTETIQPLVRTAILPLARELRSSIDFFERQHECVVTRAFGCGASARSRKMLEILGQESGMQIESWNPVQHLSTAHFRGDAALLSDKAPALAAVVGAAVAHL